jgi:hypothetical protein
MAHWDDTTWRIALSRYLAVNSSGGAAASVTSVGAQTYALDLTFITVPISTSGIRFAISDIGATAVTSTTGTALQANVTRRYKCNPGQIVQAISQDASTVAAFNIVELTK